MSVWRQLTTERRVGVVGLFAAGKTVLLTSLVNHLADHDPDRFRLGSGRSPVALRKFRPAPPTAGWEPFPYAAGRDALVNKGKWPAKTRDRSEYACRFERSDWVFSDVVLRLYDFPGERLADAAMLGRTYAEWSDHWHALTAADTVQRECGRAFLDTLAVPTTPADELLAAYRLALATAISAPHYKPFVSPSTFLLDADGRLARGDTPEAVAAGRVAGLTADAQFCPLPANFRGKRPELAGTFAATYEQYQTAVVGPYVEALRSCHALIVVVDVLHLLAAGVGACNDNRQILRDLFDVLGPGETFVKRIARNAAELVVPGALAAISKVAFVVPKIDLVHPRDRDKLPHLLKQFVGKLADDRDGLAAGYFPVSAIRSTKALAANDPERTLVGVPYRDAAGARQPPGVEQRFPATALPDEWPHAWRAGEYTFPEVYPAVPALHSYPPDQIGLDRVVAFVLG